MITLFTNGKIYSPGTGFTGSFAVCDDRFCELRDGVTPDRVVDLGGQFVCPGFTDTHLHLAGYGRALLSCDLADHTGSLSEMLSYMRDFLAEHPAQNGSWLFARGWNEDLFSDVHRPVTRQDLDTVSTEVPIYAGRTCGHLVCVNTKALEVMGVTAKTEAPEGGRIGIENGELTGMFYDNALNLIRKSMPRPDVATIKKYILAACEKLNSFGVTGAMTDDFTLVYRWENVTKAYRELEQEGKLSVRIYQQCYFDEPEKLKEFRNAGNLFGSGSDLYRIGPLKMIDDGAVGAHTAYLSEPYADIPETRGSFVYSQETLDEMISLANRHDTQVAIHAIGDACLDMVLDAYEKAYREHPWKDIRHTLIHCMVTRPDQFARIRDLGLRVHYQTVFLDYQCRIAEARLGKERASHSYAWKTMKDMGIPTSNSSDAPVEIPAPLRGMQLAVTRQPLDQSTPPLSPNEAFSVEEAIAGYTTDAVAASFDENKKGRILPGFLADFVVLSENPFETDPQDIASIKVTQTWMGGKQVYTLPL